MKLEVGKTYRNKSARYTIVAHESGSSEGFDFKGVIDEEERYAIHWFREDGTSILKDFLGVSVYNLTEEVV